MSINNLQFKFLYSFSSPEISLMEVKRLDLPKEAPVSSVYHWLVIHESKVVKLNFKSMSKGEKEFREFVEGRLEFDASKAKLFYFGKEYVLKTSIPSAEHVRLIQDFIRE